MARRRTDLPIKGKTHQHTALANNGDVIEQCIQITRGSGYTNKELHIRDTEKQEKIIKIMTNKKELTGNKQNRVLICLKRQISILWYSANHWYVPHDSTHINEAILVHNFRTVEANKRQ
jgi:hypothetical protein